MSSEFVWRIQAAVEIASLCILSRPVNCSLYNVHYKQHHTTMPRRVQRYSSQGVPAWAAQGMKRGRRRRPSSKQQQTPLHPERSHIPPEHTEPSEACALSLEDALQFQFHGHITKRRLLDSQTMSNITCAASTIIQQGELDALRHRARVLCPDVDASALRTVRAAKQVLQTTATEPVGFLQFFNSRKTHACIHQLACGPVLSKAAASLLGCDRVRLYQDCLFFKRPGMEITNWHSDARLTPLDTNDFITFWIPLRPIKAQNDSGLVFARGSHRDMAGMFWRGQDADFSQRGHTISGTGAMDVGDVSAHHGWTLHMAAGQKAGSQERAALAVSYFADGAKLLDWEHDDSLRAHLCDSEDKESYDSWYRSLKGGSVARHKDIPLVYDGGWVAC